MSARRAAGVHQGSLTMMVSGGLGRGGEVDGGEHDAGAAHAVFAAEAEGETLAGEADFAEHGGQGGEHPVRLFAGLRALERPGGGEHVGGGGQRAGQGGDVLGGEAGFGGGPFGGFGDVVDFARDVGAELVVAGGAAG